MEELISVIMSVYNEQEDWLKKSVESVRNQTYQKLEFIIVLDNPQNSRLQQLLEEYERKDSRIRLLVNEKNIGLVQSMNRALQEVRGTLVARMDADDISYPDRLETEYRAMREHQVDFVMGTVDYLDEFGTVDTHTFDKEYIWKKFNRIQRFGNVSAHPTWLLKKEVYDRLKGYREVECCEDIDFVLRAVQAGYKCIRLSEHVLQYRMRRSGISRSRALEQFVRMRYIRGLYRRNKSLEEAAEAEWNAPYVRISGKQEERFMQAIQMLWEGKQFFSEGKYGKCMRNVIRGMCRSGYFIQYVWDNIVWMVAVKIL